MSDSEETSSPPEDDRAAKHADRAARARDRDPNVFERFFPGPSVDDPRVQARIDAVVQAAERRAERERQRRTNLHIPRPNRGSDADPRESQKGITRRGSGDQSVAAQSSAPATPDVTPEDLEKVIDSLHEQTDVIRSLLDADIAIRDDARATAQNSRTFAIAGIVIAFLTLVGTAVTVVVAFAH